MRANKQFKPCPAFFVYAPAIKQISSRVPAYSNSQKVVGFCDFLVKRLASDWREVRRVVRNPPYERKVIQI